MAADGWYIYNGTGVIPPGVTRVRIHESVTVIPAAAFHGKQKLEEVDCHDRVKTVEECAFANCPSLIIVRMPGVELIKERAFADCYALADFECGKLERIRYGAFDGCKSLRSINLPSAKVVEVGTFACHALKEIKFGKELESIRRGAFYRCRSLEQITIPLKDGMFTEDSIFQGCKKLKHVDLVEGVVLRETIAALLLEECRNDMKEKIDSINQILPTTSAGVFGDDAGGKAQAVRMWIRSVLDDIVRYKAQHHSLLNEVATTLQLDLPNDIVNKNIIPFLELPSYTFEGED
eukprot:scaffold5911_cov80-Skeletonema_dohrnii-CCMP3373.AAC.2